MFYSIKNIQETKNGMTVEVSGYFGDDEGTTNKEYTVPIEMFSDFFVSEGTKIDDSKLEELVQAAEFNRAYQRALVMLGNSDYSKYRLEKTLIYKGFSKKISEKVAKFCVDKGYINEDRQAMDQAEYFVSSKCWGKKRICADLMSKGYNKNSIMNAIGSIDEDEFKEACRKQIKKRFLTPYTDNKEKARRISVLARLGFEYSVIIDVFDEIEGEPDEDD